MKDRLKKKAEKRKRQMIHELLDLALDINGMEPRERKSTGNKPTVFYDFSGHVGWIRISVHDHGWEVGSEVDREVAAHTYNLAELRSAVASIKKNPQLLEQPGNQGNS